MLSMKPVTMGWDNTLKGDIPSVQHTGTAQYKIF